jgi:hypothetical protein
VFDSTAFAPYDPSQEIIFPPSLLRLYQSGHKTNLRASSDMCTWIQFETLSALFSVSFNRVSSLDELLTLKGEYPEARLIGGNTEVGLEMKFKGITPSVLLYAPTVSELRCVKMHDAHLELGAGLSLTEVRDILDSYALSLPSHLVRGTSYRFRMLTYDVDWLDHCVAREPFLLCRRPNTQCWHPGGKHRNSFSHLGLESCLCCARVCAERVLVKRFFDHGSLLCVI